ncbi:hypothetical protein ACVXZ4_08280 [Lacisediminihabitans sp. FW035]
MKFPSRPQTRRLIAGVAIASCLSVGLGAGLPAVASAATSVAAGLTSTDTSVTATAAHQSVFTEAYLWTSIHGDPSSDAQFTDRHVTFVGGTPPQLAPTVSYATVAAGETAWNYTPAATVLTTQVYITATRVSDGAVVQSPVTQLGFSELDWRPSGGTRPTGTAADWAWSSPIATIDYRYQWGTILDGTDQQWASNAQCLSVPLSAFQEPAGAGWSAGRGTDFTPSPPAMGAMADGTTASDGGYSDGHSYVPEVARVSGYQSYFTPTMTVDVASACPGLDLTGKFWIAGADVASGKFQLSDAAGSEGNHLSWDESGAAGAGTLTSADVTATPDGNGHVVFAFAKTPLQGESGSGGVKVWAQTKSGAQVRVDVSYYWSNYGGAPSATDLAVAVPLGTTAVVTESQIMTHARFFSNKAATISVAALPGGVTEVATATGERAFQFTGTVPGETKSFAYTAAETQTPAGVVQSTPASVVFTVSTGSQSAPAPATPPVTPPAAAPKLPTVSG